MNIIMCVICRQVRMYAKMTAATSDSMFSESSDRITSEMSVTVLGDLGSNTSSECCIRHQYLCSRQHLQAGVLRVPV